MDKKKVGYQALHSNTTRDKRNANEQKAAHQANFRAWKSGKSWLYSASIVTVLLGGGAVAAVAAVAPTSVIEAHADAVSDASLAASTANSDASVVNSTASSAPAQLDTSSQSSIVSQLSSQASTFNSIASSAIPTLSSAVATGSVTTSGTVSSYSSAVSSYSSAMSSYVSSASSTVAVNSAQSSMYTLLSNDATSVNDSAASVNASQAALNTALSAYVDAVNQIVLTPTMDSTTYKNNVAAALTAVTQDLKAYSDAASGYSTAATKYNTDSAAVSNANPAFSGSAPIATISDFATAINSAQAVIDGASAAYTANSNAGFLDPNLTLEYNAASSAYGDYSQAVASQNADQTKLAAIVAAFPATSALTSTAATDLANWLVQYQTAVSTLQADISNVTSKGTAYQTALDAYNTLSNTPYFPSGNPTIITNDTSNPAQDYLNTLQTPTNTADLTTGSGFMVTNYTKYLALEDAGTKWQAIQAQIDAYNQAVSDFTTATGQIQSLNSKYKGTAFETAVNDLPNLTSADVQAILAEPAYLASNRSDPSLMNTYLTNLIAAYTAMGNANTSLINAVTTYNAGSAVSQGFVPSITFNSPYSGVATNYNNANKLATDFITNWNKAWTGLYGDFYTASSTQTGNWDGKEDYGTWLLSVFKDIESQDTSGYTYPTADINSADYWNAIGTNGQFAFSGISETGSFTNPKQINMTPPTWSPDYVPPTLPIDATDNAPKQPDTPSYKKYVAETVVLPGAGRVIVTPSFYLSLGAPPVAPTILVMIPQNQGPSIDIEKSSRPLWVTATEITPTHLIIWDLATTTCHQTRALPMAICRSAGRFTSRSPTMATFLWQIFN